MSNPKPSINRTNPHYNPPLPDDGTDEIDHARAEWAAAGGPAGAFDAWFATMAHISYDNFKALLGSVSDHAWKAGHLARWAQHYGTAAMPAQGDAAVAAARAEWDAAGGPAGGFDVWHSTIAHLDLPPLALLKETASAAADAGHHARFADRVAKATSK